MTQINLKGDSNLHWSAIRLSLAETAIPTNIETDGSSGCVSAFGANVVFKCDGNQNVYAHEAILRRGSEFFDKIFNGNISRSMHDHYGRICFILPDVKADILSYCIRILYVGELNLTESFVPRQKVPDVIRLLGEIFELSWSIKAADHPDTKETTETYECENENKKIDALQTVNIKESGKTKCNNKYDTEIYTNSHKINLKESLQTNIDIAETDDNIENNESSMSIPNLWGGATSNLEDDIRDIREETWVQESIDPAFKQRMENLHGLRVGPEYWLAGKEVCDVNACICTESLNTSENFPYHDAYQEVLSNLGGRVTQSSWIDPIPDGYAKQKNDDSKSSTNNGKTEGKKGAEKLEEPNEWCNVCHNGGDLFCCERCPRVYHLDCYVPPLKEEPPDDWTCLMCTTKDEFQKMSNSKPDDEEIPTLGERDLQVCRRVLLELYGCWPDCNSFSSVKELDFPQYHQLIKEPIALDVIKKHLGNNSAKHYKSTTKFLSDIRRMFKNCKTFWANFTGGEKYIGQAKKLEDIFINKWKELQKTTHKPIKVVAAGVSKKNNFTKHMSQTKSVSGRKRTAKMTIVYDQAQDAVSSEKKRRTNNSQQSLFQGKELEIIELDCDEDNDQDPLNITIEEQSTNKPNDKQISIVNSNIDFEIPDFMTLVTNNGDETGRQLRPKPGPACSKRRKHKKPGPASTKRKARRNSMSYQEESLVLIDDEQNQNFEQVSQDTADPVQFESLKKDNNNQMVPISFSKGEKDIVTEDSLIEYVNDSKFSTNNFAISPSAFQKYENSICEEDMDDYSEFSSLPLNSNM